MQRITKIKNWRCQMIIATKRILVHNSQRLEYDAYNMLYRSHRSI